MVLNYHQDGSVLGFQSLNFEGLGLFNRRFHQKFREAFRKDFSFFENALPTGMSRKGGSMLKIAVHFNGTLCNSVSSLVRIGQYLHLVSRVFLIKSLKYILLGFDIEVGSGILHFKKEMISVFSSLIRTALFFGSVFNGIANKIDEYFSSASISNQLMDSSSNCIWYSNCFPRRQGQIEAKAFAKPRDFLVVPSV